MRLKDKTALITGAGGGIGKAIAKAYVEEGASVIICGRNEETLKDVCQEISKSFNFHLMHTAHQILPHGEIEYVKADIIKKDDIKRLANRIAEKWSRLDILVNNASILGVRTSILDYPEDIWEEVIDVNLNGQFFVIKAVLPFLLKSNNGSIINVSSSVGRRGKALWGAYAVSKFGLEGLTQVLADELSSAKVRVNSVNPGGTRTEMRAKAYPEEDPMTLPTSEDIVPIFLYLASDESARITGKSFDARDWIKKV